MSPLRFQDCDDPVPWIVIRTDWQERLSLRQREGVGPGCLIWVSGVGGEPCLDLALSDESSGHQMPEGSVGCCCRAFPFFEAYGREGFEGPCTPPCEACRVSSNQDQSCFAVFLHGRISSGLWPPVLYFTQRFEQRR